MKVAIKNMPAGRIKTVLAIILNIGGVLVIAYALYVIRLENAAKEASAQALGFSSNAEQSIAAHRGARTPSEWRAMLADDGAKQKIADEERAKIEAERRKQWEADAPKRAAQAEEARKREIVEMENRQPPERKMKLSGQSWSTGGFETIGLMNFTVKNDNDYQVKDFVISCSFDGNSGTFLGNRLHTVYETVKAKSSRAFAKINIGFIPSQSARASCSLVSAVRNG